MHTCLGVYHANLQFISRRAWGPIQPRGNRAIHLLHSIFSKADVGMLQNVRKKTYPSADQLSLNLIEEGKVEPITLTLSKALARVKPFSYLVQTKPGTEETPGTYRFLKFENTTWSLSRNNKTKGPSTRRYYKRKGRSKEIHITPDIPAATLGHRMELAYGLLCEGSRIEVHLRAKAKAVAESVDSALKHHLHLRPDTILAAMPPGTTMLALPGTVQPPEKELQSASKFIINKTSDVFWAMENPEALKRAGSATPSELKEIGKWGRNQEFIEVTLEQVEERRERMKLREQLMAEDLRRIRRPASTVDKGVSYRDIGKAGPKPLLGRTLREVEHVGRGSGFLRPFEQRRLELDPDPEMEDGDLPDLSDLMPQRERDDGSSEPDPPPKFSFEHSNKTDRR